MVNGTTYHSVLSPNRWHLMVSFHANHTQTTRCKKTTFCKDAGSEERCGKVFWSFAISKPLQIVANGYNLQNHDCLCDYAQYDH
jgi:hypothetical protein